MECPAIANLYLILWIVSSPSLRIHYLRGKKERGVGVRRVTLSPRQNKIGSWKPWGKRKRLQARSGQGTKIVLILFFGKEGKQAVYIPEIFCNDWNVHLLPVAIDATNDTIQWACLVTKNYCFTVELILYLHWGYWKKNALSDPSVQLVWSPQVAIVL